MQVGTNSSQFMRAFIAVEIPDDVKDEIGRLLAHFSRQNYPIRWVARSNLHLTLVFLGENPPEFIDRVKERLGCAAAQTPSFGFSLKGLGVFPNPRAPRVVWIGGDQGTNEICTLARNVTNELVTIGFVPERRPFSPHLTIGRVKEPVRDIQSVIGREHQSRSFLVERVTLFQSVLGPSGPVYTILGEYPLGAARG